MEAVRLLARDGAVSILNKEAAPLWRKHFRPDQQLNALRDVLRATEKLGLSLVVPDPHGFPASLNDLGERVPYLLWARGDVPLFAGELASRCSITGSRAATGYGEHVAGDTASELASQEKGAGFWRGVRG